MSTYNRNAVQLGQLQKNIDGWLSFAILITAVNRWQAAQIVRYLLYFEFATDSYFF